MIRSTESAWSQRANDASVRPHVRSKIAILANASDDGWRAATASMAWNQAEPFPHAFGAQIVAVLRRPHCGLGQRMTAPWKT